MYICYPVQSKLFLILLFLSSAFCAKSQTLEGLADSVFESIRYSEFDSLKKFIPGYRDLKTAYDSLDMNRQAPDILITQKRVEYALKKSFKTFINEADNLNIPLTKMEKGEVRHLIQEYEGKKYSVVEIDCRYKTHGGIIFFTAIELNDAWYLGEEFRIENREVEEEIDYEKIDREAAKRKEERKRKREKLKDKAERDSAKAEKSREIAGEKKQKEEIKKQKDEEQARKKAIQVEIKRKKELDKKANSQKGDGKDAEKKKAADEAERKRKLEEQNRGDSIKPAPIPVAPLDTNKVDTVAPVK